MLKLRLAGKKLQVLVLGLGAIAAGLGTAMQPRWIQGLEYRVQSGFFETRGPVAPPDNIVILAIDDASLGQGANYQSDPKNFADLAPIQTWPWRRRAYAKVIERLMQAGAKAVALDILFTTPSAYGAADDRAFQQVLQKYGDRVVLASQYAGSRNLQGHFLQYMPPIAELMGDRQRVGFINLPVAADGKIHRLGQQFAAGMAQHRDARELFPVAQAPISFAAATLEAAKAGKQAGLKSSGAAAAYLQMHGPDQTFPHIPFWHVLDTHNWQTLLAQGQTFRDKIVVIGSTAPSQQDQQSAPFAQSWQYPEPLYGVEVQANAIATLQMPTALQDFWSTAWLNGGWVLLIVGVNNLWLSWRKTALQQLLHLVCGLGVLLGASYSLFVWGHRVVPVAMPMLGMLFGGGICVVTELVRRQHQTQRLRETLKSHLTVPLVQAIVDQQDDLRDLLEEREAAVRGKILGGRYEIFRLIGQGGFGDTYLAQDLQRPGQPECVVKQLTYSVNKSQTTDSAKRLFIQEAAALERLGVHDRIPQLLAYFEEMGEFYLVQELVAGLSLHHELEISHHLPVSHVMHLLQDVLLVLEFVHGQQVIHRDIKPSNLMHRSLDGHWVLIDFGIAKQLEYSASGQAPRTIAVGTLGYVAPEQALGHPSCTSDLYALGMTAIEVLTGITASELLELPIDERLVTVPALSPEFVEFLGCLTHSNESQRFASATFALAALRNLPEMTTIVPAHHSLKQLGQRQLGQRQLGKSSTARSLRLDEETLISGETGGTTLMIDKSALAQIAPDLTSDFES
ncbi:CHASE2 domain-containing protein [filamentous cyanobacterium LEGE 11480]|uniref:non-specific serine/threonine protein kinase n=1 Tax=Romeriopsis navalis LEGE 11480 TaxID=2777977 RepID=A0A928VNS8_9CYAN|nr:serine/threonine-protein kinase [Romeriopsis navalis]MBE9029797.1 CHASE2 domain-containing protein [Romeriopsis navalis LEGE 11480]